MWGARGAGPGRWAGSSWRRWSRRRPAPWWCSSPGSAAGSRCSDMQTSNRDRRSKEERFALLAGVALTGFALVALGLLRLQVVEHERYSLLSKENRVRLEIIRAPRGSIYDRNGELLADTAPSFSIVFRPFPVESTRAVMLVRRADWAPRVAALYRGDVSAVEEKVAIANRGGQTAILRRDAPFSVLAAVE